jgi:hypothetical protein
MSLALRAYEQGRGVDDVGIGMQQQQHHGCCRGGYMGRQRAHGPAITNAHAETHAST